MRHPLDLLPLLGLGALVIVALLASRAEAAAEQTPLNQIMPETLSVHVIDDFDRHNIGDHISLWTRGDPGAHVGIDLVPAARDGGGDATALRVNYRLGRDQRTRVGFRIALLGLDARRSDHLALWLRGANDTGFPAAVKIGFVRPSETRPELRESGGIVIDNVSGTWQRILVPLNAMSGIRHWRDLEEFILTIDSNRSGPPEGTLLVDDIALVETGESGPSAHDRVIPAEKKAWKAGFANVAEKNRSLAARLGGWPDKLIADTPLPGDDRAFLERLARDTWRGLAAFTDRNNGLPIDRIAFGGDSVAIEMARIGDYTSPTNIGLYLMAILAARELGLIDAEAARGRAEGILATLDSLETHEGFFFNFYDTTVLKRTSNFISSIDSAWLVAGLMVTRVAEPALADRAGRLIDAMDFSLLYDPVERLMSQGYYVNLDQPSAYHYGLFYTEARLASFVAIGKGDVPPKHWFAMLRTLGPEDTWQSQQPIDRRRAVLNGSQVVGGHYAFGGRRFVPSWGGSMFEALMPTLVIDEQRHAPNSLGANNEIHTEIQRQYVLDTLGYPVWGLSPSASLEPFGYAEYGVAPLGSLGYGAGVVTPHASALALETAPQAAIANLRRLAELFPIYGEFGFYDAVDPLTGRVAHTYLTLDQAMIFLALANVLADDVVQRTFADDPIAARALPILRKERFFE